MPGNVMFLGNVNTLSERSEEVIELDSALVLFDILCQLKDRGHCVMGERHLQNNPILAIETFSVILPGGFKLTYQLKLSTTSLSRRAARE